MSRFIYYYAECRYAECFGVVFLTSLLKNVEIKKVRIPFSTKKYVFFSLKKSLLKNVSD